MGASRRRICPFIAPVAPVYKDVGIEPKTYEYADGKRMNRRQNIEHHLYRPLISINLLEDLANFSLR